MTVCAPLSGKGVPHTQGDVPHTQGDVGWQTLPCWRVKSCENE